MKSIYRYIVKSVGPPVLRRRTGSKPRQGLCIGQIVNGRHRTPTLCHYCSRGHRHCASSRGGHRLGRFSRFSWFGFDERNYSQFHAHLRSGRGYRFTVHVHCSSYGAKEQGVSNFPLVTDHPFSLAGSQVENDSLGCV